MKTFITVLLMSTLFAVSTYAMEDTTASAHNYFQQVESNSLPDTTNKHQLIERVKKRGYVRVIVTYNNAQRQSISKMHDTFLEDMKELNVSAINRMKLSPLIALTVDEEALIYLYKSPLIERISLDRASKAY